MQHQRQWLGRPYLYWYCGFRSDTELIRVEVVVAHSSCEMTSVYQRSGGLVQRRTAAASHGAEGGNEEKVNDNAEYEDEDRDSKETRLTLMEEVLLLGLKDREVGSQNDL